MKQYQMKITDKALEDMTETYECIAENLKAPDTAMKQYDHIGPHCGCD